MAYFVAQRKAGQITVDFARFNTGDNHADLKRAQEHARIIGERDGLHALDVVVVKADTGEHAEKVAETVFERR